MQHYGLPTRLLDWSESPFIAAFFATHEYLRAEQVETKAASIWVVDAIKLNVAQGFEPVAPPLNAKVVEPLVRPAIKGGEETGKVTAAMAVENDPRMQVQQGAFTVHTTDRPLNEMVGCDEWLHEFIIPLDAAKRIAWQLDILGVRVSQLFPDLHNLANELRNDYLPPGKKT